MAKNSRDVIAEIAAQNLRDIMNSASPDTVAANQTAWTNQINGYEASTDKSLDDPEPVSTSNDSNNTDSDSSDNESTDDEDSE